MPSPLSSSPFIPPIIIAIVGGSCSGKTTLAHYLSDRLNAGQNAAQCLMIRQDDYYFDIRTRARGDEIPNFDVPEAIDFAALRRDLDALRAGKSVHLPNYDFTTHYRKPAVTPAGHHPYIIVEGILLLASPALDGAFDHSVYLRCDEDLRFARRLSRDVAERARTPDFVKQQFYGEVAPAHKRYVSPSARKAGRVIEQEEYCNDIAGLADRLIADWRGG